MVLIMINHSMIIPPKTCHRVKKPVLTSMSELLFINFPYRYDMLACNYATAISSVTGPKCVVSCNIHITLSVWIYLVYHLICAFY